MKKLIISLWLLTASALAAPSYTTVTATLMDSSAQVWANAQWTTEFSKPAGNNGNFNNSGVPITANQTGVASAAGVFTVVLDNNLAVSPAGSGWKFTICPNATVALCNTIVLTIFGTTQDVSTQINAILTVPVVNSAPMIARAYNDTEVHGSYGALYINSISNTLKQCIQIACNGSGWNSFGVSSNNPIFTGTLTVPCIKFNFDLTNDSTLCSQPGTGHINLLLPSTGGTLALAGAGGVPGNPTTSVQYNNAGAFAGSANHTWDNANNTLWVGPVTTRTNAFNGIPSLIVEEQAGLNPVEIHSNHQTGIDMYTHDATSGLRGPAIDMVRSRGTQASPAAINNGDLVGVINMGGYDGTVYAAQTLISWGATENWSTGHHGLGGAIASIPNGSISSVNNIILNNDGSITLGSVSPSTSPICPNGTGGALTTSGCVSGGGTPPVAPTGTNHNLAFDGTTALTALNMHSWSGTALGPGSIAIGNSGANSLGPGYYTLTSGTGSYEYLGEQGVANMINRIPFAQYTCYCALQNSAAAGGRYWLGLSSTFAGGLQVDAPTTTNIVAFRFSQAVDATWKIYANWASGTNTTLNTGVTPDSSFHQFMIKQASSGTGAFTFYIDGTLVGTIAGGSTALPPPSTPLTDFVQLDIGTGTVQLYVHSIQWWSFD